MTELIKKQEYERLCQEIWEHNRHYYIEHAPIITDEQYDLLLSQLESIEKEHPNWVLSSSPTQRVGEALTTGFKTITHTVPMLSLANTYNKDEIEEFIKRIHKLTERQDAVFSCELKMDGIAISACYQNGIFVHGVTRGDGKQGDDITNNLKTIPALPLQLCGTNIPELLEVRGEVFLPHKEFELMNQQKEASGDPLWANPRNAAAGSLKLLDPTEASRRGLSVVFYAIASDSSNAIQKQSELPSFLRSLGLPTLTHQAKSHHLDEIWEFAEQVRTLRHTLPFDIDGIVIKLDDINEQKRLGCTGKNPRWAIAYKFAAEQAITRIKEITVQVGRTGTLTPVAELDPVALAGSTIARATLHNEEEVQRKDIRIGDWVTIEKGGDVIPKVVSVNMALRTQKSTPWTMPPKCPSCNTQVQRIPGEVAVRCPNQDACPEQQLRYLIYFTSKEAMDIENLGEKVVEQLMQKGFIKAPSDIYLLTEQQLLQLEGFKAKSVSNLLTSIEKSKNIPLPHFIMALGIKHVGAGTAETLAAKTGTIEALSGMTIEELTQIEGIGSKVATTVFNYFANEKNQKEIARLLAAGVSPQKMSIQYFGDHPFNGKSCVLTGTLQRYTRSTAATLIKERGGKVTETVSKKTDFLIAGESPGSKFEKAQTLGVQTLTETEFEQLILAPKKTTET